jgi:flagellar hook protein FlgE
VFTNGLTRVIGQIALASFANNAGLDRTGNNQFRETVASGLPQIGLPNTGSRGTVSGGVLENSNVDLGREFSNLILTQRGFQANARTITAADTLLQETVNLVR